MSGFLDGLVAIDMHMHATVSTRNPPDEVAIAMDAAMDAYFKHPMPRPTIDETAACYRARGMLAVIFPLDTERETGRVRIRNEDVAEDAARHPDALIPFASVDPMRGKMGAREVRRLVPLNGRYQRLKPPASADCC